MWACAAAPGMETRVYIPEFATREINSPGEPGIFYLMGIGFASSQAPAEAAAILADMRQRAEERNRAMVDKLNAYLAPVSIDYDRDVLPLTPPGNATERHMLVAYDAAAQRAFPDAPDGSPSGRTSWASRRAEVRQAGRQSATLCAT